MGNFLSDRPSSRVLAPPGGASQVFLGSSTQAGHHQGQVWGTEWSRLPRMRV